MTTSVSSAPCLPLSKPLKRLLDLAVSVPLLVLLSPLLLLLAVAVRCTSAGPALFRQRRLGQHELPFTLLKFRTMCADAHTGPPSTAAGDTRITRVGRWLRATSLDELPQLWNVVQGHMSLVGPRPYVGFELADWPAESRALRASLKPGLTGLAQVSGRSSLSPQQVRDYDLHYVRHASLTLDLSISLRTLLAVFNRRGVN